MLADELFARLLNPKTGRKPVLKATLMLTSACCLSCVHCFGVKDGRAELKTPEWKQVIDALAEAGCFSVLITGGEPLVRSDFKELYLYCKKKGMLIDLFTNAVLINGEIIKLFLEYPPVNIDITVYGGQSEVFGRVTGRPELFVRFEQGLELLHKNNLPFSLKAMILKENEDAFSDIVRYPHYYKTRFRMDANLWPCMDGSLGPLAHRPQARKAAENEKRWPEIKEHLEKKICGSPAPDSLSEGSRFLCGVESGGHECFISPQGICAPCQGLAQWGVPFRRDVSIEESLYLFWEKFNGSDIAKPVGQACAQCKFLHICGYCPAGQHAECNGAWGRPNAYLCDVNREREELFVGIQVKEGRHGEKEKSVLQAGNQ